MFLLVICSGAVQKDYKCEHCVESFTDVTSLRIHCESLHSNSDPCSSSNIPLEGTDSPEKRMTLNRQKKKFECHVCKKTYSKQSYFEQHMERHEIMPADEKQFICDTCQKHCTSMWQLQRHIERKHSERDDTESSKLRRSLKAERAKHPEYDVEANSDGVYPCVLCPDKTFKLRRSRNDHLDLVHFKLRVLEPSHPCPVCGKLSMSRSEVRAHVTKHTRKLSRSASACHKHTGEVIESAVSCQHTSSSTDQNNGIARARQSKHTDYGYALFSIVCEKQAVQPYFSFEVGIHMCRMYDHHAEN